MEKLKRNRKAFEHQEIATSQDGRDITRGFLNPLTLANYDDTVLLARGGDLRIYDEVLRDDTVRAAVNQRLHGVIARPWEVIAGGDAAQDKAAADFLRENLQALEWDLISIQMLSGVFYGFSVAEIMWALDAGKVKIAEIKVRNRRRFAFDGQGRLRLKTFANTYPGELMPEKKFWVASFGADHADAPYGLGLAHYLYWPVFLKRNAMRFWSIYLEKFATPTVVGKYPLGTAEDEQQRLLAALEAIQRDATLIMPEGMETTLLEATRTGNADHSGFITTLDKAILKVTLGQTATVEGTAGSLGAETERERVKDAILKADADLLSLSFMKSVGRWLTEWNFPNAKPPQVWRTFNNEDLDTRIVRDKALFEMGFEPDQNYIIETYGGTWEKKAAAEPAAPQGKNTAEFAEPAEPAPQNDFLAENEARFAETAAPIFERNLAKIESVLKNADSWESAFAELEGLYRAFLDDDEWAELMGKAFAAFEYGGIADAAAGE